MMQALDNLFKFRPETKGEHLFLHVANHFVSREARKQVYQLGHLQIGNRQEDFAEYYIGVYCFNVSARLIKRARHLIDDFAIPDNKRSNHMRSYLRTEMEIATDNNNRQFVNKLVSLSIDAALSSDKPISPSTKKLVASPFLAHYCYICGNSLQLQNGDEHSKIEYEHIWPSSLGGDSIPENLLPACGACNKAKGAMLLWQDAHVHSFILKPYPGTVELTSIRRSEKIALHRRKIFSHASNEKLSLKEAALKVGAMGNLTQLYPEDASDFFNCTV